MPRPESRPLAGCRHPQSDPAPSVQLASELREGTLERGPDVLALELWKRGQCDGVVEPEVAGVHAAREAHEGPDRHRLLLRETTTRVVAVARHDRSRHELRERVGRGRPFERIGVSERWDGTAFDEIAGKDDVRIAHRDDEIVVGVTASEVPKLDRATSDLDRRGRLDRSVGWIDCDGGEVVEQLGRVQGELRACRPAGPGHQPRAIHVSPDFRRTEDPVAKGVVVMAVRVDHDRYG